MIDDHQPFQGNKERTEREVSLTHVRDIGLALLPTDLSITQPMRWFLLIAIVIWLFAAMIATLIIVCITKNLLFVSLFSTLAPPAYLLYWITKHLFPMDERGYKLEAMKIQARKQKS